MLVKSSIRSISSLPFSIFRQTLVLSQRRAQTFFPNSYRSFSSTPAAMASNSIKKVLTDKAYPPMGPYSQAIIAGNTVYCSGQIPADVKGEIIQGDIAAMTRQIAENLKAVLEEAGSSMEKIIKCTVFLDDMANFAPMNAEYEKHFISKPTRTCVAVKQLPKGVPIEIECIALV